MTKLPTLSLYSIDWDPKPKGVSIAQDCAKRIRKRENPHHVAESHKMSYDQMRHLLSTELDTNVSTLIGNAKPKNRRTMPEVVKNKKPGWTREERKYLLDMATENGALADVMSHLGHRSEKSIRYILNHMGCGVYKGRIRRNNFN